MKMTRVGMERRIEELHQVISDERGCSVRLRKELEETRTKLNFVQNDNNFLRSIVDRLSQAVMRPR